MKAIVLEGGGILGAGQAVALQELSRTKKIRLEDYSIFVGTSVGAVNGLALALGMNIDDLVSLWERTKEKDVMPKKFFSFFGERINKVGQFVEENIIKVCDYNPNITLEELYMINKKLFYTVAYVIQLNKGVIFGKGFKNAKLSDAVKYTTSHPLKFKPNEYKLNGITYDLSDGGIIQNCPIAVIAGKTDLEEILCVTVSIQTDKKDIERRYTDKFSVIKRIMTGMVSGNEYISYAVADSIWGNRFKIVDCKMPVDLDIFDTNNIKFIMDTSRKAITISTVSDLAPWLDKDYDGRKFIGDFRPIIQNSFI